MASMNGLERETTINFNDEEHTAEICTFQARWMTRLRKHSEAKKLKDIEIGNRVIGAIYEIPKSCITLKRSKRVSTLTDEQRKEYGERMKRARQSKA